MAFFQRPALFLEKAGVKSVPFHGGATIEYQVGYLGRTPGERWIRYTRSMKTFRSFYRVTLQFEGDETRTPYVFELRYDDETENVVIRPENESAKAGLDAAMRAALEDLYHYDIGAPA